MDFTNRGQKPQQSRNSNENDSVSEPAPIKRSRKSFLPGRAIRALQAGLLVCIAILVIGVLLSIATTRISGEDRYVDSTKVQAVFLNGGQVYFGKIGALNKQYMTLSDIYYLQVTQQVQPGAKNPSNNFTLAKLGCELHRPTDTMVINRDQIVFWENLKDESGENTVPGAIKKYVQTTGGKQECAKPKTNNTTTP